MKTGVQENQLTLKELTVLCVHTSLMKLQLMLDNELSFSCIQEHWPFYSEEEQSYVCSFVCCSKLLVEMICNNLLCGVFCSYLKF
jgi:hypothetical protein